MTTTELDRLKALANFADQICRMAENGEGGYRLLSRDWSDYNKYLGNALEIEGLSRKQIERLQAWAYLKYYLWNFRLLDLLKIIYHRWRESAALVKRIAARRH